MVYVLFCSSLHVLFWYILKQRQICFPSKNEQYMDINGTRTYQNTPQATTVRVTNAVTIP